MKLSKFLSLAFIITSFCLFYVWQQTKIFSLAYEGQKNLAVFKDLLDGNSNLRYNLKKRTSLVQIGTKVQSAGDFQMPDNYCLVKLGTQQKSSSLAALHPARKRSLLSRIFDVKRQAEAKTITSSNLFRMDGR